MKCIVNERSAYLAASSVASIGSLCIFREQALDLQRQQPHCIQRKISAAACTSRKSLPSLLISGFPSVARAAKHLKIQICVGAAVLERQDVIDVRVLAVAHFMARPARERIAYKNPLTLRSPVR